MSILYDLLQNDQENEEVKKKNTKKKKKTVSEVWLRVRK